MQTHSGLGRWDSNLLLKSINIFSMFSENSPGLSFIHSYNSLTFYVMTVSPYLQKNIGHLWTRKKFPSF